MIHKFKMPGFMKAIIGLQVLAFVAFMVGVVYLVGVAQEFGMDGVGTAFGNMSRAFNEASEVQK